jgi:AcrR family transcriptional regulator
VKAEFLRARSHEEKTIRRGTLLTTARALLHEGTSLRTLSLNEIARHAGMAKANVYRYFETREALLIALLWEEWQAWFQAFRATYMRRRPMHTPALAKALATSIAERPLLCALTAALPTVIEQNLSEDGIRAFKRNTLALFAEAASFLSERCPTLSRAAHAEALHDIAHAVIGLYPSMVPSPAAARVIAAPEFRFFRRDFRVELTRFAEALLAYQVARAPHDGT